MASSQMPVFSFAAADASAPPFECSWEVIEASELFHRAEAEAADFLLPPEVSMSELSEKLRSNMQDLQETITRLTLSEDTTRGTKETELPEPVDVMEDRPGLGLTPPGADRVPLALSGSLGDKPAPGFVRPETHAPVFMPVRYVVDPQNDAFFKLFVFPESFSSLLNYLMNMLQSCSEQEIVILFAQFMNSLMTEATARRILEATSR